MVLIWEIDGLVWFSWVKTALVFGVETSGLGTVWLGETVGD